MSFAESVHHVWYGLQRRLRRWWLRQRGMRMEEDCWIQDILVPRNAWDIQLGEGVSLDRHVTLISSGEKQEDPRIFIHNNVYINRFSILDASDRLEIGAHTMIGPHCYITDHDHGLAPQELVKNQSMPSAPVSVGEDVWIGAGATILKGVSVGEKAVIGAGAVVTDDVEAGAKVAGVPGRPIGRRVPESSRQNDH